MCAHWFVATSSVRFSASGVAECEVEPAGHHAEPRRAAVRHDAAHAVVDHPGRPTKDQQIATLQPHHLPDRARAADHAVGVSPPCDVMRCDVMR
eukprot:SAG25_NODE_546_length_7028_cov_5.882523_9_plen_94_part_00